MSIFNGIIMYSNQYSYRDAYFFDIAQHYIQDIDTHIHVHIQTYMYMYYV